MDESANLVIFFYLIAYLLIFVYSNEITAHFPNNRSAKFEHCVKTVTFFLLSSKTICAYQAVYIKIFELRLKKAT